MFDDQPVDNFQQLELPNLLLLQLQQACLLELGLVVPGLVEPVVVILVAVELVAAVGLVAAVELVVVERPKLLVLDRLFVLVAGFVVARKCSWLDARLYQCAQCRCTRLRRGGGPHKRQVLNDSEDPGLRTQTEPGQECVDLLDNE